MMIKAWCTSIMFAATILGAVIFGYRHGTATGFERGIYVMSTMVLGMWQDREIQKMPQLDSVDKEYWI